MTTSSNMRLGCNFCLQTKPLLLVSTFLKIVSAPLRLGG